MPGKSTKWELGFVHSITKFTISRFVISRFSDFSHLWKERNDDDAYFYGPILFLKRGDFGGTLRSWREIAIICISENWTHSLSIWIHCLAQKGKEWPDQSMKMRDIFLLLPTINFTQHISNMRTFFDPFVVVVRETKI